MGHCVQVNQHLQLVFSFSKIYVKKNRNSNNIKNESIAFNNNNWKSSRE